MNMFALVSRTLRIKKERNWDTIYIVIDLHGTLVHSEHDKFIFYPHVVEVMKWFNSRGDIKTILWTASAGEEIHRFLEYCKEVGIRFDYVNENPDEKNSDRADFDGKFYFNILLDDKAGFDPDMDWAELKHAFIMNGEWFKKVNPPNPNLCFKGGEHEWVISSYDGSLSCGKCNRRCPYSEVELLNMKQLA